MKNNKNKKLTFETAMNELELLVKNIEDEDLSLNEVVNIFERSTFLMNYCSEELKKVETKIYKLNKNLKLENLK
tara:strand:- start:44 stop:265 length:222 start_codon:yes stop_codon:yes gene_type:complete